MFYDAKEVKVKGKGKDGFQKVEVSLADRYLAELFTVEKPEGLLNPAEKTFNGEFDGINDPSTHLSIYKIKEPKGFKFGEIENIGVENQFGTHVIDIKKPKLLLVPAAKRLPDDPDPDPLQPPDNASHRVDHYLCYDVKESKDFPKFSKLTALVLDQFLSDPLMLEVKKPKLFCTPVDKNGEGIKFPDDDLLCYDAKPAKGEPKFKKIKGIEVADQFGLLELEVKKEQRFCVPSLITQP